MTYGYGNYVQQNRFYKAVPIANESDMNNITVDFNGTPTYFHNQMTNEIYVRSSCNRMARGYARTVYYSAS